MLITVYNMVISKDIVADVLRDLGLKIYEIALVQQIYILHF
jgi:hypothetical protein